MTERTRGEHLEWSKQRAREYMRAGDYDNAVASMLSDLKKHPAWHDADRMIGTMVMLWATDRSAKNAERIIEGFN